MTVEPRSTHFNSLTRIVGRRIEEIDGGWRLLNHAKYRAIRDEEAVLEAKRKYINTRRAVENVDRGRPDVGVCIPIAEAEAEAEAEDKPVGPLPDIAQRKSAARGAARGARNMPRDWWPAEELLAWAAEKFPGVRVKVETEAMRDYTFSRSIVDWNGAWRNWIRKAAKAPARYQGAEPMWLTERLKRSSEFAGRAAAKGQQPAKEVFDVTAKVLD
jgi:hypothetical protein